MTPEQIKTAGEKLKELEALQTKAEEAGYAAPCNQTFIQIGGVYRDGGTACYALAFNDFTNEQYGRLLGLITEILLDKISAKKRELVELGVTID